MTQSRCVESGGSGAALQRASRLACGCAGEPFDEEIHESLLRRLWTSSFPACPYARISQHWLAIGFQSADPTRDIRGVGTLGLRHLARFCEAGGLSLVRQVSQGLSSFPLATASLNVTQMLCSHLGLLSAQGRVAGGVGACSTCCDAVFLEAWRLHCGLPDGTSLVDLLHEHMTLRLFDDWQRLSSTLPTPLMEFPRLLNELGEHMTRTLARTERDDLASLLLAMRRGSPEPTCWDAAGSLLEWLSPRPMPSHTRSKSCRMLSVAAVLLVPAGHC